MSNFTRSLKVSPLADGLNWVLLDSFCYDMGEELIEVEKGFITDFASIPRFLWMILPKWGKYGNAAVVHDYIYWNHSHSRKEADDIMMEAMKVLEVPAWKIWAIYWAVRLFGGLAWKANGISRKKGVLRVIDLEQVILDNQYQNKRPKFWQTILGTSAVRNAPSSREELLENNPMLASSTLALAGLKVRHGDVIDALTPIFAEIDANMNIKSQPEASDIGGEGGAETVLLKPGYLVTGINLRRGMYFGRDEVIHLELIWQKLTPNGFDPMTQEISDRMGSGNYAKLTGELIKLRPGPGHYISDIKAMTSYHTSGETFLHQLAIEEKEFSRIKELEK